MRNEQQNSQILLNNEREVIEIVNRVRNARTQQQIQSVQELIKKIGRAQKNLTLFTNVLISKTQDFETKVVIVASFNLFVQQKMKKFYGIKIKKNCQQSQKKQEQIKRQMVSLSGKLERGIDSKDVPVDLKPKLVVMQMKITNRSKQDWDCSRIVNKMQFYYRKNMTNVAMSYFSNILLMSYSIKQKIEIMKKVSILFPGLAANQFIRIVKGEGLLSKQKYRVYGDFNLICTQIISLLNQMYLQISKPIIIQWCNTDIWMTLIASILQQIEMSQRNYQNGGIVHPRQEVEQWRVNLIHIFKKMTDHIGYHNAQLQCTNFLNINIKYLIKVFQQNYISVQNRPHKLQQQFGVYLPLLINAIRFDYWPQILLNPYGSTSALIKQEYNLRTVSRQQKQYYTKQYLLRLCGYLGMRTEEYVNTRNEQQRQEYIEYVEDMCSAQEIDYECDNFAYNYYIWMLELVQKYSGIGFNVKRLITCLLFINDRQQYRHKCQYLTEQVQIVNRLLQQHNNDIGYVIELGLMLCLVFYRCLSKDRDFVTNTIQVSIHKLTSQADQRQPQIFAQNAKLITIFMLVFRHYINQVPVYVRNYNMRIMYKYTLFVQHTTNQLCNPNLNASLCGLYLYVVKAYIRLIKSIIKQVSNLQIVYIKYGSQNQFQQLQQPLRYFHQLTTHVPTEFYIQLYQQFIDYHIFKKHGQSLPDTILRVRQVLSKIIACQCKHNTIFYQHSIFKVFAQIIKNQQYCPLFIDIFNWISHQCTDKKWLAQYQQDITNLCITLLKQTNIMATLDTPTKDQLWKVVYLSVYLYQFEEYSSTVSDTKHQRTQTQNQAQVEMENNLRNKQLLVMHMAMTFDVPDQMVWMVFKKACANLQLCIKGLTQIKNKVEFYRGRPYQQQQISFLLILHQLIINHNAKMTHSSIQQCLNLVWLNLQFRKIFAGDFNFVNGKYNLVALLLMRYCFVMFNEVVMSKGRPTAHAIYYQLFFNQHYYIIRYDVQLFVQTTVQIVPFIWSPKYELQHLQLLIGHAHFAVGACIFCLDRVYEAYKYDVGQELEVEGLSNISNDPILTPTQEMHRILTFLTSKNAPIDQFKCFRKFYDKLKANKQTTEWFKIAMNSYVAHQHYIGHYRQLFNIHKIVKQDGTVIYRKYSTITRQLYQ